MASRRVHAAELADIWRLQRRQGDHLQRLVSRMLHVRLLGQDRRLRDDLR